jgi:hypothetical protein
MENENYTGLVRDMSEDRKQAEYFMLNYEQELAEYNSRKEEFLDQRIPIPDGAAGGKGNVPGKPTEVKAVRGAQYDIDHPEYLWLKAVEVALRTFGERKRIFIAVRREAARHGMHGTGPGRRGWVVYTQRRYSEEIEKRFLNGHGWLSEKTIRLWWCGVVDCVVEIHLRLRNINF